MSSETQLINFSTKDVQGASKIIREDMCVLVSKWANISYKYGVFKYHSEFDQSVPELPTTYAFACILCRIRNDLL